MGDEAVPRPDVPDLTWRMAPVVAASDESGLLVLLPGADASAALWEPTVSAMRRDGSPVRILSIHLTGTGTDASVADLARAVIDVVDRVGGGRFWVAGAALGGRIGLELALGFPERVRGVGVFGIAPGAHLREAGRDAVLDQIRVPAIVVAGESDGAAATAALRALAEALPLGDSAEVPGSAIVAPSDRPRESAGLLGELVGEAVGASRV